MEGNNIKWKWIDFWHYELISCLTGFIYVIWGIFLPFVILVYFFEEVFLIVIGIVTAYLGGFAWIGLHLLRKKHAAIRVGIGKESFHVIWETCNRVIPYAEISKILATPEQYGGVEIFTDLEEKISVFPGTGGKTGLALMKEYCSWNKSNLGVETKIKRMKIHGIRWIVAERGRI